jgi:hypothetical protein
LYLRLRGLWRRAMASLSCYNFHLKFINVLILGFKHLVFQC